MSDAFYRKLSTIFGLLALAALFVLLIFIANLEIKDLDLWLHMGMGRTIVQNHFRVPDTDILSCTIAGRPWINHEWLFQVLVYYIERFAGPDGLITMQVIVVTLTMMILFFLGYNREKQLSSIFILLLVALVYQQRFTIRPDLFSLLFFAAYIFVLSFYLDKRWSPAVLVAVQVLWSNMHGFFFFGPLFVLIGIVGEWLRRHVRLPYHWNRMGRLNNEEFRRLKWIFLVVILACLVNPLTFRGAWYPVKVFFQLSGESKVFFTRIIELQRPIAWGNIFSPDVYPYYKLLILLSFLSFVFNRRKIDVGVLIFWLVFLLFSLAAVRNLIYFAFAAYLVFVNNALGLSLKDVVPLRITDKKFVYMTSIIVKTLLIFWILQYGMAISLNGYFDFDTYQRKSEFGGISLRAYPYKAVDFLVANKVKGRFFNDFNTGAYLIGRCYPDIRVFIDGRTEVYGPAFFKYYQELWEKMNPEKFAEMLEKYQMTGALLDAVYQPIPKHALDVLYQNKDWVCVYFDYDAAIFLKDIPQNRDVIERCRVDLPNWQAKGMDLMRLGSKNVTPYQNINRAYTLLDLGLYDAAMAEARAALRVSPRYVEPYKVLGKVYAEQKDFRRAFENFRIATVLAPRDKQVRLNLATSYYDLGAYGYAIEQFQKIIDRWPQDPKAYFRIARALVKTRQYPQAYEALQKGFRIDPKTTQDVLKIGDLALDAGQADLAKRIYDMVLDSKEMPERVHLKLGQWYQRQGDLAAARAEIEKGLRIKPDDKDLKKAYEELIGQTAP